MRIARARFAAFLLPFVALAGGCGSSTGPGTTTNPINTNAALSGDWGALASASGLPLPTPVADFIGSLQFNGSAVTGTMRALPTGLACASATLNQDLSVAGTFSASSMLTLSVPIAGGTATISAQIVSANSYNSGTWQIVGGQCAMPATAIQLAQFVPATGTYSGTVSALDLTTGAPISGSATDLTVTVMQSGTPNADGQYPLVSGSVSATGNCPATLTLTNYTVAAGLLMPPQNSLTPRAFTGGIDPAGDLMFGALGESSCPYSLYIGTLTRQ